MAGFVPHVQTGLDHHFWEETSLRLNCLNTSVGIQTQSGFALGCTGLWDAFGAIWSLIFLFAGQGRWGRVGGGLHIWSGGSCTSGTVSTS